MKYGYVPTNFIKSGYIKAIPMPGLYGTNGLFFDNFHLTRLTEYELRALENDALLDELEMDIYSYGREMGSNTGMTPLFLVFTQDDPVEESTETIEEYIEFMVLNFCLSAWLVQSGRLYNPLDFISYSRNGNNNSRDIGLYGRSFFEIEDGYCLTKDVAANITTVSTILRALHKIKIMPTSLKGALGIFSSVFSFNPFNEHRHISLFTCLTLLLDDCPNTLQKLYESSAAFDYKYPDIVQLRNKVLHGALDADLGLEHHLVNVVRVFLIESIVLTLGNPEMDESFGVLMIKQDYSGIKLGDLARLDKDFSYSYD